MKKFSFNLIILILFTIFPFMVACGKRGDDSPFVTAGFTMETVSLDSPYIDGKSPEDTEKALHILYINDIHLQILNDEVAEEEQENIKGRIEAFSSNGTTTLEKWEKLPDLINAYGPDYVIFGGDILDFCSEANVASLKEGLDKLTVPYMYIRSDHDRYPYWLSDNDNNKAAARQDALCDNSKVLRGDVGPVTIVAMNPSDQDYMSASVEEASAILDEEGRTFIVATHIPYEEEKPGELDEFSMELRGKALYWYNNTDRQDTPGVASFIRRLYEIDTPFFVPAAHLHASFETRFSEYGVEHVFTPEFMGSIGEIIVY